MTIWFFDGIGQDSLKGTAFADHAAVLRPQIVAETASLLTSVNLY
jgi:hypothetical protein